MIKILSNKIQCNHCKTIIESKHCHDFVYCECGKVACDGGREYLKRSGYPNYTELSETEREYDER